MTLIKTKQTANLFVVVHQGKREGRNIICFKWKYEEHIGGLIEIKNKAEVHIYIFMHNSSVEVLFLFIFKKSNQFQPVI